MQLAEYITSDTSPFKKHFHSTHELVLNQKLSGSESGFFAFPIVTEYDLAPERLQETIQTEAQRLNYAVKNNAWNIPVPAVAAREEIKSKQNWFGLFRHKDGEMAVSANKKQNNPFNKN